VEVVAGGMRQSGDKGPERRIGMEATTYKVVNRYPNSIVSSIAAEERLSYIEFN
jgi:hypothetical protein